MPPTPSQTGADLFDVERLRTAWVGEPEAETGRPAPVEAPPSPAPVALLEAVRSAAREAVGAPAPAIEQLLDRAAPLVATVSGQAPNGGERAEETEDGTSEPDEGALPLPVSPEARQAALTELEVLLDQVEDLLEALVLGPQRRLG